MTCGTHSGKARFSPAAIMKARQIRLAKSKWQEIKSALPTAERSEGSRPPELPDCINDCGANRYFCKYALGNKRVTYAPDSMSATGIYRFSSNGVRRLSNGRALPERIT